MDVSILVISHDGIGSSLLGTAMQMITDSEQEIKLLAVEYDSDPEELLVHTRVLLEELDQGDGVLILTDLYGSTPSNVAMKCMESQNIRAVAGLNLSMLLRVMNYPELGLQELADLAVGGGEEGVKQIVIQAGNAN